MNAAVGQGLHGAWRRLASSPSAVFIAVLSLGLGASSAAQHLGLYPANSAGARRCNVVLACPRTSSGHSTTTRARGTANAQTSQASATDSPAAASSGPEAGQSAWLDKNSGKKPGDGGLTVPLPDFSAPELSRFISPL